MAKQHNMFMFLARRAWLYAEDARPRMVTIYVMFIIANIVVAFQPVALAQIINTAQKGGPESVREAMLWAGVYAALNFTFWLFHGPARVIERRLGFTVFSNFVRSLYRKVTEMPLRWHQDHHSGDTINRVNKAGRALYTFTQSQFVIIQSIVRLIVSFGMLIWYSWWVAAVSIAVSVVIAVIIRRFDKVLIPMVRRTNEREHHLNAALYDYIGNIVTVLTLRLQGDTATEINKRFDAMKASFWPEVITNEIKWLAANFLLVFVQAMIVGGYVAAHLWSGETLAIGSVVAIFQYLFMIMQLFFQGMVSYEDLLYKQIDVRGVDKLLEEHGQLVKKAAIGPAQSWKEIRIEHLTFTHQEGQDVLHTLHEVGLAVKAGQKIALIGESGSGKTTLLTLMRGLYDAQKVTLSVDGAAGESLSPLAAFTTLVPQDSEIFENTVLYNITLATDVPEAMVQQAVWIAGFEDVAAKLPMGLYTDIRERGVNLSGGQKQRLALARGLIAARASSLLLLDEPTSSVDMAMEATIFDRLLSTFGDKAIIASVHRLHLLPRFDHICFMQGGEIVEQGSFNDLLAKRGAFHRLWQNHLVQIAGGEGRAD